MTFQTSTERFFFLIQIFSCHNIVCQKFNKHQAIQSNKHGLCRKQSYSIGGNIVTGKLEQLNEKRSLIQYMGREGRDGLVVTHSRFIMNVIVFLLLSNFSNFSQYYHQLFYSIQFLRHLKESFGLMFKIQAQQSDDDNSVAGGESKILL